VSFADEAECGKAGIAASQLDSVIAQQTDAEAGAAPPTVPAVAAPRAASVPTTTGTGATAAAAAGMQMILLSMLCFTAKRKVSILLSAAYSPDLAAELTFLPVSVS
jgi:hypothetical protein